MLNHATLDPVDSFIDFDSTLTKVVASADTGWKPLESGCRLLAGELVPGTRLKIIGWLGEGSMGQVFEVLHVDIQRRVALKVLRASVERSAELSAVFANEAKACVRVESRFVVDVMDFGELPDGRPFFVMELLGGEDLHGVLQRGSMSLARALPILRQCCKAVAAIHEAGMVHRDVKPKNVVLQDEDGRADAVRVVDLGLAAEPGTTPRISGTVAYMAPEQIIGGYFDGGVDIYALGCMAYVMLAGRPPFEGSIEELFEAHTSATPPPITELRPELPARLDGILLRCLEKSSAQRWPSAHELEAALIELQIAAGLVTPWDDLPMPKVEDQRRARLASSMAGRHRRPRWMVSAGLGVMLVLGAGAGLWFGDRVNAAPEPVTTAIDADETRADSSPDAARIEALTNQTRLAASKAYWVYPPESGQATALSWIGVLEDEDGQLAVRAQNRALELRREIADTLVRLGDRYWTEEHGRAFALEFYANALVFVPELPHALERSPLTPTELADLRERAKRAEFRAPELRAAKVMAALADTDDARRRERVVGLVANEAQELSWRSSGQLMKLVGADVETLDPLESPAGAGPEPEPDTKKTVVRVDLDEEQVRSDPPAAAALVSRAHGASARGQRSEARRLFNEALAFDSVNIEALTGLAELHFEAGEYSKALGFARKAAHLRPHKSDLHILVGDCYLKAVRYAEARAAYERAASLDHRQAASRLAKLDELIG